MTLLKAVWLVVRTFGPVAALTALILFALRYAMLQDAGNERYAMWANETIIATEQIRRARTMPRQDAVIIGDSSCLLGIHTPTLGAVLSNAAIEGLCSYGYIGPAGYAWFLDELHRRGVTPRSIIVVFSGVSLQRDASWEWWPSFIRSGGPASYIADPTIPQVTRYVRRRWLSALYEPREGRFGWYYGDDYHFAKEIREDHGSATTPSPDMRIRSLDEFKKTLRPMRAAPTGTMPAGWMIPNNRFMAALDTLAETVDRVGPHRVYLLLFPSPDYYFSADLMQRYASATHAIADRSHIPRENILSTQHRQPDQFFIDAVHMNSMGARFIYSGARQCLAAETPT